MKKIEVNFYDNNTGATSAIDVITVADDYTEQDYMDDCIANDESYAEMFEHGEIKFVELED